MEALIAHTMPVPSSIVAAKAHTEAVTARIAAVTSNMNPFEHAATAHERMAKLFLFERVFAPSDPNIL